MRKLIKLLPLIIILTLAFSPNINAFDRDKAVTVREIFTAEEIEAGGTAYSIIFDVTNTAGQSSIQIELTGDGTAKFEWVGTNDVDAAVAAFIKPAGASDIVTSFTKTSGPGSDGKHIYSFQLSLVKKFAIKVTETGLANTVTVTAILAIQ